MAVQYERPKFNNKFIIYVINTMLIVVSACYDTLNTVEERPVVTTSNGIVRGIHSRSYNGRIFSAFYGIPYAKPPVGDLRFADPVPADSWDGIWEANFTTYCLQLYVPIPSSPKLMGDEDCLYLNVFIPRKNPAEGKLLNVICFIHGSAQSYSAPQEMLGPEYLMDKDLILITFTYRLGPFGFLSTQDDVVPGNAAMKDQVAVLKWIQTNIKNFGGNPQKVTIGGLSSGAACAHFHYLSPQSRGLFTNGISISGTALSKFGIADEPLAKVKIIALALGCSQNSTAKMIKCIRQRPGAQIINTMPVFRPITYYPGTPFTLVVEKNKKNAFLPEHPYLLMIKGQIYDVPWLVSLTDDEGLLLALDFLNKTDSDLDALWDATSPYILDYTYTVPEPLINDVTKKIRAKYFGDIPVSQASRTNLTKLMSDRFFGTPTIQSAKIQALQNKSPVYFFRMGYKGEKVLGTADVFTTEKLGVSHGDDAHYIFLAPGQKMSKQDEDMKNVFITMWDTFTKNGKPQLDGVDWKPVSHQQTALLTFLQIQSPNDLTLEMQEDWSEPEFWSSLPLQENANLFKNKKL